MRVKTANIKSKRREFIYEVINHITFWIKLLFGDIVLIVLNMIIWSQDFKGGFRYAGLSFISTAASTLFGSIKYVFASPCCQHDPLYRRIATKLRSKKESSSIKLISTFLQIHVIKIMLLWNY